MKPNLLLIDDDPAMLAAMESLVEGWGYKVHTARSGKAGLELLESTPIDAVVSDVRMPGISGEEVLARVVEDWPGLPVILLTAHGSVKDAVAATKRGAFDYALKPIDEDELKLTVERALEHSRLRRENEFLRAEIAAGGPYGGRLIGESPKMQEVFDLIDKVARTDSTVLITGETGTGKELVAQTLHLKSKRAGKPFLACNCAALNTNLLESELFGHEKGAFTGAISARRGRFEDADGGTLFLDEIGETSIEFQAKLLRVLQEREFERVGGNKTISVDVRVVASSNRDLGTEVKERRFREDLYYRLRVVPVRLPALKERGEDVLLLADHFLQVYRDQYAGSAMSIGPEGRSYLLRQEWKGNVRELQHTIERAVVLAQGEVLGPDDLRVDEHGAGPGGPSDRTLQAFLDHETSAHVIRVLDSTNWQKQRAAEILGIDRATLYRMIKKYRIESGKD